MNTRRCIPCPSADELDLAPQMIVVVLADAALLAVDRALDSAHPMLAATNRFDRPPPWLIASEHLAAQVLDLSAAHTTDQIEARESPENWNFPYLTELWDGASALKQAR